jgi:hypothetical protein
MIVGRLLRTLPAEDGHPYLSGAWRPQSAIRDGWGARGRMKDASSTDVIVRRGTALTSFYQCGDLYRLDPTTARTLGKATWGGAFPFDWGVSAHPKADEATGRPAAARHGVHRELRHPQRLPAVLGAGTAAGEPARHPVPPGAADPAGRPAPPRRLDRRPLVGTPAACAAGG